MIRKRVKANYRVTTKPFDFLSISIGSHRSCLFWCCAALNPLIHKVFLNSELLPARRKWDFRTFFFLNINIFVFIKRFQCSTVSSLRRFYFQCTHTPIRLIYDSWVKAQELKLLRCRQAQPPSWNLGIPQIPNLLRFVGSSTAAHRCAFYFTVNWFSKVWAKHTRSRPLWLIREFGLIRYFSTFNIVWKTGTINLTITKPSSGWCLITIYYN